MYIIQTFTSAFATHPIMPSNLAKLLNAVALNRFDPMIGFPFVMGITAGIVQKLARLSISNAFITELSLFFLSIAESGEGKGIVSGPILKPLHDLVRSKRENDARQNQERQIRNSALIGIIAEKKKSGRKLSGPALSVCLKEIERLEAQIEPELPDYVFDAQDITTAALSQCRSCSFFCASRSRPSRQPASQARKRGLDCREPGWRILELRCGFGKNFIWRALLKTPSCIHGKCEKFWTLPSTSFGSNRVNKVCMVVWPGATPRVMPISSN